MYARTVFVIDQDATVGGLAGGLADLASLGAFDVQVERCDATAAQLPMGRLAEFGESHSASLVVVGASNPSVLTDGTFPLVDGLSDRPLLYVWVNSPVGGPLLPDPRRILSHVLAPGDYSIRSACAAACLRRVVTRGARVVTLMHVRDDGIAGKLPCPPVGELGRVDMEWVEHIKRDLLHSGVEEVRFITHGEADFDVLEALHPPVSLVLVGGTCSAHVARSYGQAAMRLCAGGESVPALMLSAESHCPAAVRRGAA